MQYLWKASIRELLSNVLPRRVRVQLKFVQMLPSESGVRYPELKIAIEIDNVNQYNLY